MRKCFILTSGVPSVNNTDLRALTLVGPTGKSQVLDPLAVICFNNRLYIIQTKITNWIKKCAHNIMLELFKCGLAFSYDQIRPLVVE